MRCISSKGTHTTSTGLVSVSQLLQIYPGLVRVFRPVSFFDITAGAGRLEAVAQIQANASLTQEFTFEAPKLAICQLGKKNADFTSAFARTNLLQGTMVHVGRYSKNGVCPSFSNFAFPGKRSCDRSIGQQILPCSIRHKKYALCRVKADGSHGNAYAIQAILFAFFCLR